MIVVRIDYRETLLKGDTLIDFRDLVEASVGHIFEEELSEVDVVVAPFGALDTREEEVFITVEIPEECIHHELKILSEQFVLVVSGLLQQILSMIPTYKVWVQRPSGFLAEVWTSKQDDKQKERH